MGEEFAAVKVLQSGGAGPDYALLRSLQREAGLMASLHHENIVGFKVGGRPAI